MSDGWGQPAELLGRILEGRYRVDRIIGQGGMGTVFEGVNSRIDKRVALKVLSPAMARDQNHRARFLNEARAAARISSPHVVSITDYGRDPVTFVVMEFLEGEDLAHRLAKTGPLGVEKVLELLRQICAGLEAAHKKGVVHRDIKPSNIFLAKGVDDDDVEMVKILDFGIAKLFDAGRDSKGITRPNEVVGTATYMAPEQVLGAEVDRRSDIYSLGVVLFRMLVGKVPFRAESTFGMMEMHVRSPPPALNIGSPQIESVVLRCLEKGRERRLPNARALLREFEGAAICDRADDSGKGRRKRTLVPSAQEGPVNTEVTGHPGFPLAVEQSLTEQALTSDERAPPPQHDPTLPSAGVQPPLGDGSSARRLERPAPLTLALVLGCSMVVGGAGFAWRYSADSLVPRNAALMVEPLGARSTSSNDLPVPTLDQPPAYPEPLALGLADVEVVTQANETPFDGLVLTIPEKPANDRISPVVGHRTPSQRARHKRSRERESPARQRADPLHSVVVEAMLKDAQKAALSDPAYCFQLAAEAQAMRPSQQAAIVMIKCACRLGDADKANAAAKLLRGEHPKLKRLCELKGVELVMGGPRGRKPTSEL